MTSINTNAAAMTALQTLKSTNKNMDVTQNRISTGFRVSEAAHNAAYWSIATTMRSDNNAMSTVKDALGLGSAQVDIAYTAMDVVKDTLDSMKKKIVAASQPDIDTKKIQEEIKQLQNDLQTYAKSATFSGGNWLDVEEFDTKKVVASFIRDAGGAVSLETIDINTSKVALFVNGAGSTDKGMLQGAFDLTVPAPSVSGLTASGASTVPATGNTNNITVAGFNGLQWAANDTFTFSVDVDGTATDVTGTFDGTAWTWAGQPTGITVSVNSTGALDVAIADTAGTATDVVSIGSFASARPAATPAGVDVTSLANGTGTIAAANPTVVTIAGAGDLAWDAGATFSFDVTLGTAGTPATVTGTYDGSAWSWANEPAGVTIALTGSNLVVTAAAGTGPDTEAMTVNDFASTAGTGGADADATTVTNFDITTLDRDQLQLLLNEVDSILSEVTTAASDLGAIKTRIASQQDFVGKLMDAVSRGVGQLVDADMTEESTRLQALQVQQQLGIQALSIANGNSQNILSLFRG